MKMIRWGKKKLTFVVIPDARKSVFQLRIPVYLILFILSVILSISTFAAIIYTTHIHTLKTNSILESQLNQSHQTYQSVVQQKDQAIAQLQNKVISLSKQTDAMEEKVQQLTDLKNQLLSISRANVPKQDQSVQIASTDQALGKGGEPIHVTEEEMMNLADDTQDNLQALENKTESLYETYDDMKKKAIALQHLMAITPSIWPTISHVVSSPYGYRKDPITGQPSFHDGIDLAGRPNDPVYATADGTVIFAGYNGARGNNIIVNHTHGMKTIYMHLHKILVKSGQKVKKGQTIGRMGSTGRSTGTHLHYGVFKNGNITNPWSYMHGIRKDELHP